MSIQLSEMMEGLFYFYVLWELRQFMTNFFKNFLSFLHGTAVGYDLSHLACGLQIESAAAGVFNQFGLIGFGVNCYLRLASGSILV